MLDCRERNILESDLIRSGMARCGIDAAYAIVIADEPDIVESTAANGLSRFFRKASMNISIVPESRAPEAKRILLGRVSNFKAIEKLDDAGIVDISQVCAEDDGFHLKRIGCDIVIAGANPRGVLYGTYELEDHIRDNDDKQPDIRKIPYFRKRMGSQGYYFSRYLNLITDEFTDEKAEYLARLGVNEYLSGDTCYNMNLHYFVKSGIFPFQEPPDEDLRRKIKAISTILSKYGIDYYHSVYEPTIVHEADADKYPPEALGRVRRPWGGDSQGTDRTLCVNSPIVQAHYRDMMRKFVREFKDVKGFHFYNMDFNTWLCTPELCPRCAEVIKDSPHDIHNPWETQALLVTLLGDAAREERPDFKLNFFAAVHYHGEALENLLRQAKGYDSLLASWNGSDRDIMLPAIDRPKPEFYMSKSAAEERGALLYVDHEFNRLESCQPGFPYPFQVCETLKKYKEWGVKNLTELGGPVPAHNAVNALVMKAFEWNPDQDPADFLMALSTRQFGETAGRSMFKAWEKIRDALDVWKDYMTHPFSGSQPYLGIGTIWALPVPILPGIEENYEYDLVIRTSVEPWRAPEYQRFREVQFLKDFIRMGDLLSAAELFAREAVEKASHEEYIELCYYMGSADGIGRPTCKEHAELNHAAIEISEALCRQRINMIKAVHLLNKIKSCRVRGDEDGVCREELKYKVLIREDIRLQKDFLELMICLCGRRPCLVRTGMMQQEIEDCICTTREKLAILKKYLSQ